MLKRNFVKTGVFGHGLLLLLPNVTAVKGEPLTHSREIRSVKLPAPNWKATDSLGMPAADTSMGFTTARLAEKKVVAAPQAELNKQVTKFVKSFLVRENASLRSTKSRSKSYFKLIDTILTKYGIPLEMKYLAVIESDLKTTAVSRVGAKGLWQLMPKTGRELGLKINRKHDERTQVYKSTVAAAKYLKDLYSYYGDWLLVIAAYNGGPGTVDKAIRKAHSRNFWVLQAYLPRESRGHVKRFIGTHYYFEGKGSVTTLTKPEAIAYNKKLQEFRASQERVIAMNRDTIMVVAASLR